MYNENQSDTCAMCEREKDLTFHHLFPRSQHSNKWFRKNFSLDQMRTDGVMVCELCHSKIHQTFDEKELGRYYNTLDKLIAHPQIEKFIGWARKQK